MTAANLDDWMAGAGEEPSDADLEALDAGKPEAVNWWVDNFDTAERAMATLAGIARQEALLAGQAKAWREKVDGWVKATAGGVRRRRRYYEAQLIHFARQYRAVDPKRNKTLPLPSGKVSSTERQPVVVVADRAAFIVWAWWNRPELLKVTVAERLADVRKAGYRIVDREVPSGVEGEPPLAVTVVVDPETGEPVPGLGVEYPEMTFNVVPDVVAG